MEQRRENWRAMGRDRTEQRTRQTTPERMRRTRPESDSAQGNSQSQTRIPVAKPFDKPGNNPNVEVQSQNSSTGNYL